MYDNIGPRVHEPHHLGEELGGILKVGVEDQNAPADRLAQPGRQGKLVAVVAREVHQNQPRVRCRQLQHARPGAVRRSVVDQDDLGVNLERLNGCRQPPVKLAKDAFLVVARHDDGEPEYP